MAHVRDLTDDVVLTHQGRRLFEEQARRLREETIPSLVAGLQERNRDARVDADYLRAIAQLQRAEAILLAARSIERSLHAPRRVELGDTVSLRNDDAEVAAFTIVHPLEAPLDGHRISVLSPLSQALLGRAVGDEVEVRFKLVSYRCRIVGIESEDAHHPVSLSRSAREGRPPV